MTDWEEYRFFKFRYTLKPDAHERTGIHAFLGLMGCEYDSVESGTFVSAGFETLDKFNKPTHPHWHFHFAMKNATDKTIGALRKRLQRYFKTDAETRKGNELYSLSEVDDVNEITRFFRYPWKQGGRRAREHSFCYERLPPEMTDINTEIALAREEQSRMWEWNIKKAEKAAQPDTRDKLFEYLDEINEKTKFTDRFTILEKICEFYGSNDKSANKATLMGYLQTALWKYGLETYAETSRRWLADF